MHSEKKDYVKIEEKDLPDILEVIDGEIYLKNSGARPFKINFPLYLDEDVAKIPAMIMDGSVNKKFYSFMFSQKKDKEKIKEFSDIIKKFFNLTGNIHIHKVSKTPQICYSSKTLTSFLYHCLNIHKSDEEARIPYWIWISPKSVIREYLRYAFAMEGSISHYLKTSEIKFHSVDLGYIKDLKRILKEKFEINSHIQEYFVKDYGFKYFLYFGKKEDVIRFGKIGFALKSHQKRLNDLINNLSSKAWEITLAGILKSNKRFFMLNEANKLFPDLCKRAVHHRLTDLVNKGFLQKEKKGYSLTGKGWWLAINIKNEVKMSKLRTKPRINEQQILDFLNLNKLSYRNEIARELKLDTATTRDVLMRLLKQNKIQYSHKDKFQRIFYKINSGLKIK